MGIIRDMAFKTYKQQAIDAAKDLLYSKECIEKLHNAKTEGEIERIMKDARHGTI